MFAQLCMGSLESFEISDFSADEAHSKGLVETLATCSSLQHIWLPKASLVDLQAILLPLSMLPKLEELNLSNMNLYISDAHDTFSGTLDAMSERLTSFELSCFEISNEEILSLGPSLAHMAALRVPGIRENDFRSEAFADLLSHNSCLTHLEDFRFEKGHLDCEIDDVMHVGLCPLAAVVPQLQALKHLQPRHIEARFHILFPPKGSSALARAFVQLPALRHVDLYHSHPWRRATRDVSAAPTFVCGDIARNDVHSC
jgi:hypothetical protein